MFCATCGKVRWRPEIQPVTGCKCAPPRRPGQLRAAVEAARAARAAAPPVGSDTGSAPVQLALPDRPSMRALVLEDRERRASA